LKDEALLQQDLIAVYYLRQGGYVFATLCLLVCFFVCLCVSKITQKVLEKSF